MSYLTKAHFARVMLGLAALLLATIVAACLIGSVHIDLWRALQRGLPQNVDAVILFETRLPRVLLAAIVGAALAAAGAALQGLLRNPLAEPHLIGISGGAALGAVAAVIVGGRQILAEAALLPLAASAGALLSMAIVYRLALVHGRLQPYVLLLAGVVYNAFTGALIMCVNAIADLYQAQGILFWLMGNLGTHSYTLVAAISVYVLAGSAWLLSHARALNVLSLGEEGAAVTEPGLRAMLGQRELVAIHPEQRTHQVIIAGGDRRPVGQARVLPPVAATPAAVVGIEVLFRQAPVGREQAAVELHRKTTAAAAGHEITLPVRLL